MSSRTIMVQGTTSSAGKSLLATALCRWFRRQGLRVAPFKAQNMALNSFVTPAGGEIGRAQAVQAEAAGVEPAVDMNPILLKPEGESRSQVVVLGEAIGSMSAREYHARKPELRGVVAAALARLRARHDLVVIEGAGSPAEINLKDRDLVNMYVAKLAGAPVLLAGDIDRGGVFASFVGTMELLDPDERSRIAAFIVNKFRGDVALLRPGLEFLETRTGVPVLGVVPFVRHLRLADEDSLDLDARRGRPRPDPGTLDVVVVRLPRISNHDELQPLEHEPGVALRFVEHAADARGADLLILPGSKSTVADLAWLRESGLATVVEERARAGEPVLGICGGCQMLGETIEDPHGVESDRTHAPGLGLLPLVTRFQRRKLTAQVRARVVGATVFGAPGSELRGYEIHMGAVERRDGVGAAFEITSRNGEPVQVLDGAVAEGGAITGTLIHGLLENDAARRALLGHLRRRRGLPVPGTSEPAPARPPSRNAEYDRLADLVEQHLDLSLLRRLAGI